MTACRVSRVAAFFGFVVVAACTIVESDDGDAAIVPDGSPDADRDDGGRDGSDPDAESDGAEPDGGDPDAEADGSMDGAMDASNEDGSADGHVDAAGDAATDADPDGAGDAAMDECMGAALVDIPASSDPDGASIWIDGSRTSAYTSTLYPATLYDVPACTHEFWMMPYYPVSLDVLLYRGDVLVTEDGTLHHDFATRVCPEQCGLAKLRILAADDLNLVIDGSTTNRFPVGGELTINVDEMMLSDSTFMEGEHVIELVNSFYETVYAEVHDFVEGVTVEIDLSE